MKLFILGHARHGKDFAAEILADEFGYRHESSSHFCMRVFLREAVEAELGFAYDSDDQCFDDRVNHRQLWFDLIRDYTRHDPAKLARQLFDRYDIYVGIRSRIEYAAARHLADLSIWIDATDRLGTPLNVHPDMVQQSDADVIVQNNGTPEEFRAKLCRLFSRLLELTADEFRARVA